MAIVLICAAAAHVNILCLVFSRPGRKPVTPHDVQTSHLERPAGSPLLLGLATERPAMTTTIPAGQDPKVDDAGGAKGGEMQRSTSPAGGGMEYAELQCEGGKRPDVDLSYWKNIPQDK